MASVRDVIKGGAVVDTASETAVFENVRLFQSWDDDYYPPSAKPFYDRTIARMLKHLGCRPGDEILDAGCGPGEHSIRAARAGMRVTALDCSEAVLELARARAAAAGVKSRISFLQQDLTSLDLPAGCFRAVFCWGVVIHIPAIEQALGELVRVLRPEGRLALYVTNAAAWDHVILRAGRKLLGRSAAQYEELPFGRGRWHDTCGDRLWVWHLRVDVLTSHMEKLGLMPVARLAGEFTELQRRLPGALRRPMLWFNRAYSAMHLPPGPCADNLLIFEKCK